MKGFLGHLDHVAHMPLEILMGSMASEAEWIERTQG